MKKKLRFILTLLLILTVSVSAFAAVAPDYLQALKSKILSFISVDTSVVHKEYVEMTNRINTYIDKLIGDAKKEIADYQNLKNQQEIDKIKDKEKKIKDDLKKTKEDAVVEEKQNIDTLVSNDISKYDEEVSEKLIEKLNSEN